MKLIKLSEEHYIGVDESEIKEGDFVYSSDGGIFKRHINNPCQTIFPISKITHSTQPIEEWKSVSYGGDGTIRKKIYDKIKPLSLSEVKELFGEVDVEKKADEEYYEQDKSFENDIDPFLNYSEYLKVGFIDGYNQALEDNKERKYTERDMIETYLRGATDCHNKCIERNWKGVELNVNTDLLNELAIKHIKSIQLKKEWEVEFVDGKLKLK